MLPRKSDPFIVQLSDIESNGWIYTPEVEVYVRKAWRGSVYGRAIDVSNVVVQPGHHGNGVFGRVLDLIEAYAVGTADCVWVENVQPGFLRLYLQRRGYTEVPGERGSDPSYWKKAYVDSHGLAWEKRDV